MEWNKLILFENRECINLNKFTSSSCVANPIGFNGNLVKANNVESLCPGLQRVGNFSPCFQNVYELEEEFWPLFINQLDKGAQYLCL
jgi:hypothetical protein